MPLWCITTSNFFNHVITITWCSMSLLPHYEACPKISHQNFSRCTTVVRNKCNMCREILPQVRKKFEILWGEGRANCEFQPLRLSPLKEIRVEKLKQKYILILFTLKTQNDSPHWWGNNLHHTLDFKRRVNTEGAW